jgi:hypothetical protein
MKSVQRLYQWMGWTKKELPSFEKQQQPSPQPQVTWFQEQHTISVLVDLDEDLTHIKRFNFKDLPLVSQQPFSPTNTECESLLYPSQYQPSPQHVCEQQITSNSNFFTFIFKRICKCKWYED